MNEVSLSNDLNVITAEINSYKQVAGQSFVEIGKRLIHVKENNLTHGDWKPFLENIQMSKSQADRFMAVAKEYEMGKLPHVGNIGFRALYEIATLPQEEREKEHTLSSGETKTVDEMTVRELQEVKRKNKELQRKAEQAERSERIALKKLEEMEDKEPEVIEREVIKEVDNTDYERIRGLEEQIKRMKSNNQDVTAKEKEVKLLQLDASKSVLKTKITIDEFLQEVAVTSYRRGAIAASSEMTKSKLREGIEDLKNFIKEMEMALNGTIEH